MAGRHRAPEPSFNQPRRACAALISVSLVSGFFSVYQLGPAQSAIALPIVPLDNNFTNSDVPSNAMPIDPSLLTAPPTPTGPVEQTAITAPPDPMLSEGALPEGAEDAADDKGQPVTPTSGPRPSPTPRTSQRPAQGATESSVTRSTSTPSPTPRPRVTAAPVPTTAAVPRTTAPTATVRITLSPSSIINGGLKPNAAASVRKIAQSTGFNGLVLGYRPNATDKAGHPAGLGADFMVYNEGALGDKIAAYILANQNALGVKYIIWRQRYNMGNGWQTMEDRGGITANHFDHVHVSFNP